MAWRSIVCISFLLVWSNLSTSAFGEDSAFTVLFGSEETLQNLQQEVGEIKQSLTNLEMEQKKLLTQLSLLKSELNDNILESVKTVIVTHLKSHETQRWKNDMRAQEVAAISQQAWMRKELVTFHDIFLVTLQRKFEQIFQQNFQEKFETQTKETRVMLENTGNNLIETINSFIKPLKSEILSELKKTVPNVQQPIESTILNEEPPDIWPSYTTFLQKPKLQVKRYSSTGVCERADVKAWKILEQNVLTEPIYCLQDPGGGKSWRVIQRRHIDGSIDFNQVWHTYRRGFGTVDGDFFIGLDTIHRMMLPNKSTELWIQLGTQDGHSPYEIYRNFVIASAENDFQLIFVYGANGTAGDELTPVMGEPFQALQPSGLDGKNCAERIGSGWWYPTDGDLCGSGNLNRNFSDITWGDWNNIVYTHMAIRHSDNLVKVEHRKLDDENKNI